MYAQILGSPGITTGPPGRVKKPQPRKGWKISNNWKNDSHITERNSTNEK